MPKNLDWNGPQSSEALGREKLTRDESARTYPRPRDISKIVDEAQTVHEEGFAARLPRSK
jgi:hypothetical protein